MELATKLFFESIYWLNRHRPVPGTVFYLLDLSCITADDDRGLRPDGQA